MCARALLYTITAVGAAAAMVGIAVAYYAIARYEPRAYHFVLTTLGVLAAAYGFVRALRSIRSGRIAVGSTLLALTVVAAGTASTIYGFTQAYRGVLIAASGTCQVFWFVLVTIGLGGALYGLSRGLVFIIREHRRRRAMS